MSHPVSSPARTVDGLIAVYEASVEQLGGRLALNLPALNVTRGQMLDALEEVAGPEVRARVRFERDETHRRHRRQLAARRHRRARGAARPAADEDFADDRPPVHRRLPRGAGRRRGAERTLLMNQIDLQGRVAVVTGGAQGIGYAIAERMLASGAAVVLWDVDAEKLAEAKGTLGARRPGQHRTWSS